MLPLTPNLKQAIEISAVLPSIVMEIDGYPILFSNISLKEYIRIGDPLLLIGPAWVIGGLKILDGQDNYITFDSNTTTKVNQKLDVWKAQGASVTSMTITLVDKNEEVTHLASPGFDVTEILGRDVTIYTAVDDVAFPEDYNIIFQGVIQAVNSKHGNIDFVLSNTEEKKRASILTEVIGKTVSSLSSGSTTFHLEDASEFFVPQDCMTTLAVIGKELVEYTGISTNDLTGVSRAQEGSVAISYNSGEDIHQWLKLSGNGLELALKVMLSQGPLNYIENIALKGFVRLDVSTEIAGAIYFDNINLESKYGVAVGDTVVISGATNVGNNITGEIAEIGMIDFTTYIIFTEDFVIENPTAATANFQSRWNTLPIGLGMKPKEVDVKQHLFIRDTWLPFFTLEVFLKECVDTKVFIETELYNPMACFSVPRKGRSSVACHAPPLASAEIKELDDTTVKNGTGLKLERSITENFFNEVTYSFDYFPPDEKFKSNKTYESTKSKARIPKIGNRPLVITSNGLRTASGGETRAMQAASRFLKRFQFGAEFMKNVDLLFKTGYALEIGDIVIVNFEKLELSNYDKGRRSIGQKLFEVSNHIFDIKTGGENIDLINTAYGVGERYGVISPSSLTDLGSTTTKLKLKKSFTTKSFQRESTKWTGYRGQEIIVHTEDWSIVYTTHIRGFDNLNPQSMLVDALPTAPGEDWIIQCPLYPSTLDQNDLRFWKLRHAFFSPQIAVTATVAGFEQIKFEVDPGEVGRFYVGSQTRIHTYDYSDDSPEGIVTAINGVEVTIDTPTGFTIDTTHFVDLIGFPDEQNAYRIS